MRRWSQQTELDLQIKKWSQKQVKPITYTPSYDATAKKLNAQVVNCQNPNSNILQEVELSTSRRGKFLIGRSQF